LGERRLELRLGCGERFGIAVPGHDAAAFAGKALGDAEADAARSARDDGRLSIQSCGHVCLAGADQISFSLTGGKSANLATSVWPGRIGVGRLSEPVSRKVPAGRSTPRARRSEKISAVTARGWRR